MRESLESYSRQQALEGSRPETPPPEAGHTLSHAAGDLSKI
jgi:hypothetical protein